MKATEATELALDLLRYLETKKVPAEQKLIALQSAASTLEHIRNSEASNLILETSLRNLGA